MSRSPWKFFYLTNYDVDSYIKDMFLEKNAKGKQRVIRYFNNWTINTINYMHFYGLQTGKYNTIIKVGEFMLGRKIGEFIKCKRPFFFRPKKKKKK